MRHAETLTFAFKPTGLLSFRAAADEDVREEAREIWCSIADRL
jgi:hypothetical protein